MANDEKKDAMLDQTLDQPATRRDLLALETATRGDLLALEMRVGERFDQVDRRFEQLETRIDKRFEQIDGTLDNLRRHFDVVNESFKTEFRNLFDWTTTTTSSLGVRLDRLEEDHHTRMESVELRVTRLEPRPKQR